MFDQVLLLQQKHLLSGENHLVGRLGLFPENLLFHDYSSSGSCQSRRLHDLYFRSSFFRQRCLGLSKIGFGLGLAGGLIRNCVFDLTFVLKY